MSLHIPTRILPKLWQGPKPACGSAMGRLKVDVVVLCAEEYQPAAACFPDSEVIHCPFDDTPDALSWVVRDQIFNTAAMVGRRVSAGKNTMVTCNQGINRSGLVVALAVSMLIGCSGAEAVRWVQRQRPGSLRNRSFVGLASKFPKRA